MSLFLRLMLVMLLVMLPSPLTQPVREVGEGLLPWASEAVASLPVTNSEPETLEGLPETVTIQGLGVHGLHCRQGPSTTAPLARILFDGETVPVRGGVVDGWLPVECAGHDGWIMAEYVLDSPSVP